MAFLELIHEVDVGDITIHALCKKANYTRSAFYSHFNSKEDLIHQIIEHHVQTLRNVLEDPYRINRRLDSDSFYPAALLLFDHIYSNRNFYRLIQHPDFQLLLQDKLMKMFIHHFQFDLHFEYAGSNQLIEKEIKAYHLAYATLGVIHCWIDQQFRFSSQYMAEEVMRITTTPLFCAHYTAGELQGGPPFST